MSKKAKRAARKGRKTIITGLRCERDNYMSLAQTRERERDEARAEVKTATAQADESSKRSLARVDETMRLRSTIDDLKVIIADLEQRLAYEQGRGSALDRQIDQAAEKVMVCPPVMLSPTDAKYVRANGGFVSADQGGALRRAFEGETKSPRHWATR